jgi:hypothetical protein
MAHSILLLTRDGAIVGPVAFAGVGSAVLVVGSPVLVVGSAVLVVGSSVLVVGL